MGVMDFPCTSCGECCKRIGKILQTEIDDPITQLLVERFPYKTDATGACEMLGADNKCMVYDNRPLLCDIKKGAVVYGVGKKQWYLLNAQMCNKFMDDAGLDVSFRIDLSEI